MRIKDMTEEERLRHHLEINQRSYAKPKNRKQKNKYMREYYKRNKADILAYKSLERLRNHSKFVGEYARKKARKAVNN